MRVFIALSAVACLTACVSASYLTASAASGYAPMQALSTGSSSQFREEDSYGNYKFGYEESSASGNSARREERQGDVVRGSYNLGVHDGRSRRVDYIADASGFRATVHTNEPGVDASREPAAVLINKEGYAAVPAPEAYATAPRAYTAPAPTYAASAPTYAAPAPPPAYAAPVYASPAPPPPAYAVPAYAAPAPSYAAPAARQAFSYSFGTSHPEPSYAAPAPAYATAPAYQQARKY